MTDINKGQVPSDPVSQMKVNSNINDQMKAMTLVSTRQLTLVEE